MNMWDGKHKMNWSQIIAGIAICLHLLVWKVFGPGAAGITRDIGLVVIAITYIIDSHLAKNKGAVKLGVALLIVMCILKLLSYM